MKFLSFFALFFFGTFCFVPGKAVALLEEGKYTLEEQTAFAFFHLTGTQPDFTEWIKSSEAFKNLAPKHRFETLRREEHRLQSGFYSYSAEEDLLLFTTKAIIEVAQKPEKSKPGIISLKIIEEDGAFIPIKVGKIWIAMIPDSLEALSVLELDDDRYTSFQQKVGLSQSESLAVLQLWLRPVQADGEKPVYIGDTPYWPIIAEVGSITVWDDNMKNVAWSYDAPWYVPRDRQQYMDLFNK